MTPFHSVDATPVSVVFPEGDARARFSPLSALARPRRRLIDAGADPGAIVYLAAETPDGARRVLGILSAAGGERLRFFPGIAGPLLAKASRRDEPATVLAVGLDHLTLDVGTRTARFASGDSRGGALGGILGRRPERAPDVVGWFGFMVPALDRLEPLPGEPWRNDAPVCRDPMRRIALLRRASRAVIVPMPAPGPRTSLLVDFLVDLAPDRPLAASHLAADDAAAWASRPIYNLPRVAGRVMLRIAWRVCPAIGEPAFAVCV